MKKGKSVKIYNVIALLVCAHISFAADNNSLYDATKSFKENVEQGPFFNGPLPRVIKAPPLAWKTILGYPIETPIGVAANAVTTSEGVALAVLLGYNIITYKTVRSSAYQGHQKPNVCHVAIDHMLTRDEIKKTFHAKDSAPELPAQLAISNSMGMGCLDHEWVKQDIAKARASIGDGQLLIVSVFGSGENEQAVVDDFVATAKMAEQAGAQAIEINLSCPNINAHDYPYKNISFSDLIIRAVAKAVCVPVTTKVGLFDNKDQMRAFLIQAACAGARGICGINSVPVKIINEEGKPYFGQNRQVSGLSGAPLRQLAKEFIQDARAIIDQEKLNITLFATGGITTAQDFKQYLDWGADVALTATGFIYNPLIASEFKRKIHIIRLGSKL